MHLASTHRAETNHEKRERSGGSALVARLLVDYGTDLGEGVAPIDSPTFAGIVTRSPRGPELPYCCSARFPGPAL
jgi:hypothetical protein